MEIEIGQSDDIIKQYSNSQLEAKNEQIVLVLDVVSALYECYVECTVGMPSLTKTDTPPHVPPPIS